mgnify:FL=1|jgi:hypothetical protein|nr:MAG TPA_asm: hypothetical protein [Caudoviricetes sp.]DAM99707.1 MAG TPA: hypothetical protein [Caudoviricetes sp.]
MKELAKMYLCYMEDGSNCIYCNPYTGRAEPDEINIIIYDSETVHIVNLQDGTKGIEFGRVIYTDHELISDSKNKKLFVRIYNNGDEIGRPTGKLVGIAEMVL